MGQTIGQLSQSWDSMLEEKDRVIHWSGEILSRIAENIQDELMFQMDYDTTKLDEKVEKWVERGRMQMNDMLSRYQDASEDLQTKLSSELEKLRTEYQSKMRKDYDKAYGEIKKFTKKLDNLSAQQNRIHEAMQQLQENYANDLKKCQKKFGELRAKTFDNLRVGEKMALEEGKLKSDFAKRVYDIDHKNASEYEKKVTKLLKDFEKSASK